MDDSKKDIMEATYKALSDHGYSGISIKKIADEAGIGKSAIYYHFEDKEELMLEFLDHMIENTCRKPEQKDPEKGLDKLIDRALGIENEEEWELQKAFLELKAQAPRNEKFQKKFRKADEHSLKITKEIMKELGFQKPEEMASILNSCIEGAVIRKVATGDREGLKDFKKTIKQILNNQIVDGCLKN